MGFHQFLYLNKILSILNFIMKNLSDSDYLKSEYKKINKLFLLRKFDLVIEKTKKILKKNSTQIPFYNLLALSYRETGNLFLSEKTLIDALKIKPNDQSLLVNLGSVYRVLIEYKKSEKYLLQALSINPENINAIVNYANLKRDTNNYNESIQMYEKAYKIDDKNPIILINLAGIYQIVGKFSQSQKLLEKLLSQEKKNALAHKMLSTIKKYEIKDNHQTEMLLILKENLLSDSDKATLCFAISNHMRIKKIIKNHLNILNKQMIFKKKYIKNIQLMMKLIYLAKLKIFSK